MIEKILPVLLTAVLLAMGISGAGSDSIAVIPSSVASDEVLYNKIMDSIGPDLASRAQAAGFSLNVSLTCYSGPGGSVFTSVSAELRSAVGTTMYGENTVDWELMRDVQHAIIDSGVFEFTTEEIQTAKDTYYTPDSNNADINFPSGVNLHINETPFGYEAILYLRHNASAVADSYTLDYSTSYDWDGLTYDSRS